MERKTYNITKKVMAILSSFLVLFANTNFVNAEEQAASVAEEVKVSDDEVKAFKVGAIFASFVGLVVVGASLPMKEVKHAMDYRALCENKYKNFVKSFPKFTVEKKSEIFAKQEGYHWDWAACLGFVMRAQKNDINLKQKDIVKRLFNECAFFEHNRKESLPVNAYYDSELLESINELAAENGMDFVRKFDGFGVAPKIQDIKNKILAFYSDNGKNPFVINDSYFYNGNPFVHFVVVSEIDDKNVLTVRDPAVGLIRKQPLEAFCKAYIHDNGYAKLPSIDMFTLRAKSQ